MNGDATMQSVAMAQAVARAPDRRLLAGLRALAPVPIVVSGLAGLVIPSVIGLTVVTKHTQDSPEFGSGIRLLYASSIVGPFLGALLCVMFGAWSATAHAELDPAARECVSRVRASLITSVALLIAWSVLLWASGTWVMPLLTITIGLFALMLAMGVSLLAEHIESIEPRSPAYVPPRRGFARKLGKGFVIAVIIAGMTAALAVVIVGPNGSGRLVDLLMIVPLFAAVVISIMVEDLLAQARGLRRRIELARTGHATAT